jgi:hypothetical protein
VNKLEGPGPRVAVVVVAGLVTGIVTQLGQSVLPTGWSQAANSISPWLLVTFLVGSTMPTWRAGLLAGIVTLVLALVGYYAMTQLRYGIGGGSSSLLFWGLGAVVGGPVFGVAGRLWRDSSLRTRSLALGLLAAAFLADAGFHAVVLSEPRVGLAFGVAGLLVPLALGRSAPERLGAYGAAVPGTAAGALGFAVFLWLNDVVAAF